MSAAIIAAARALARATDYDSCEGYYPLHACCNGGGEERYHYGVLLNDLVQACSGNVDDPDLPDGWEWNHAPEFDQTVVRHNGTPVAWLFLAQDDGSMEGEPPLFASEIADGLTRLLAGLGG